MSSPTRGDTHMATPPPSSSPPPATTPTPSSKPPGSGAENEQAPTTILSPTSSYAGSEDQLPPPAYGSIYGEIQNDDDGFGTRASVEDDGRVHIRIQQRTRGLSSLLVPALRSQLDLLSTVKSPGTVEFPPLPPTASPAERPPPPLNIVIQVVGSRGDVQPFVALGKVLKEQYTHRVRLATHPVFKDFVEEHGLEFFSIGGDPAELMAFMVKNPGLMPGFDTLRSGDVGKRRREIGNMIKRCWRSCIEAGDGSGVEASDSNAGELYGDAARGSVDAQHRPFVADAIIANPPSFAHVHCAEKLGIPLHMMFTMPWSPTQAFPHPLANITSSNAETHMSNFISYALVDMMTWQGLGDVINRFRQKTLVLEPISATWAPGMLARMRIPWTYCWSPALIPKPRDWGDYISISGFYLLSLASNYTPDSDLAAFLDAGPPPVYIGFGSIVVDDPDAMTKMIFDAVKKSGQRALVSKGWGGFGADQMGIPKDVFMLGNVPHDWLFRRVSCVVHHGGAGTTAAGIACGKPTVVVPFFGDQPFWGAMVAKAGAGPPPVPYKKLTADILAESIRQALKPEVLQKAEQMSERISQEKGTESGANSFHKELDVDKMRCLLCPKKAAVWRIRRTDIRLSAFVVAVLANAKLLKLADLKLYRPQEHHTEDEPFDPITGGASALVGTMGSMAMGVADMPVAALKALKIHPDSVRSRSNTLSPEDAQQGLERSPSQRSRKRSSLSPARPGQDRSRSSSDQQAPDRDREHRLSLAAALSSINRRSPSPAANSQAPEAAHTIVNEMTADGAKPVLESPQAQSPERPSTGQGESAKYNLEDAVNTGKGVSRIVGAGIKSPMDFTLGLARGFRNAPKLYGDETVRKSEKVTGFSSGLRVAGKEFGHGFYDGISGLVTQPLEGARKEGMGGFLKGVGMGIGGAFLKPGAAIWGLPGYTSEGIYKELQKKFGPSVENWIIASRTAQGYEEFSKSTEDERANVIRYWKELKPYIRKKKTFGEEQKEQLREMRERSMSAVSRTLSRSPEPESPKQGLNRADTDMTDDSGVWTPTSLSRASTMASIVPSSKTSVDKIEDGELEEAIRRSVADTSQGNAEDDAAVEQAIRTSIAEMEAHKNGQEANAAEQQQAMKESIARAQENFFAADEAVSVDSDSSAATEKEHDESELARALRVSAKTEEHRVSKEEKAQKEEEIVLNYIMKQSLAEEEMKKTATVKEEA